MNDAWELGFFLTVGWVDDMSSFSMSLSLLLLSLLEILNKKGKQRTSVFSLASVSL